MPTVDFSSYHQAQGTTSDGAKFDNFVDAAQTALNALDNNNIANAAGIVGSKLATGITGPPGTELDYAQIVADVSVTGTSGAQTTVITGGAVTYDGATTVVIEAVLVGVLNGASDNVFLELWDGATSIGVTPAINTAGSGTQVEWPVVIKKRLTPSAAAHTYTLKAYRTTANGTIKAGPGTAGAVLPSFMRITKV